MTARQLRPPATRTEPFMRAEAAAWAMRRVGALRGAGGCRADRAEMQAGAE